MAHPSFRALPAAALLAGLAGPALASEASDVARETRLPVAAVETVFATLDAFYASAQAPLNRQTSGQAKELVLKALKHRVANLDDAVPGKASDATLEERAATYRAEVRTTRHETTESRDCVDNKVTLTVSESVPAVKDGAFVFDGAHPRVTGTSWAVTFCRAPLAAGGWSDWALAPAGR